MNTLLTAENFIETMERAKVKAQEGTEWVNWGSAPFWKKLQNVAQRTEYYRKWGSAAVFENPEDPEFWELLEGTLVYCLANGGMPTYYRNRLYSTECPDWNLIANGGASKTRLAKNPQELYEEQGIWLWLGWYHNEQRERLPQGKARMEVKVAYEELRTTAVYFELVLTRETYGTKEYLCLTLLEHWPTFELNGVLYRTHGADDEIDDEVVTKFETLEGQDTFKKFEHCFV